MITCLIKNNGERTVVDMTYKDLWREMKDIPNAQIRIVDDWIEALPEVTTKLVCFVEADCLVSSGYFDSLLGLIKKNAPELNKMAVFSPSTAVNNWAVKFYGYNLGNTYSESVIPNKEKKSTKLPFYTTQIAYIPGAVIRTNFLRQIISEAKLPTNYYADLVLFSALLSLTLWKHNWMIYLAPNSTYCTTEDYVNDIAMFDLVDEPMTSKFKKESV